MAHGTLIGGTAYEIGGGRTLVGGTGYDIDKGKTLVDGTGYEISFSTDINVTITGEGRSSSCYAKINGTRYTSETDGIIVQPGEIIEFRVSGVALGTISHPGIVNIDGVEVLNIVNQVDTYEWTIPSGIKQINIVLEYQDYYGSVSGTSGQIFVTTS